MRKFLTALAVLGLGSLAFTVAALAADAEPTDHKLSSRPSLFEGGIYIGPDAYAPTQSTSNKITAHAVRTYAHSTPLVDGGTCAGAVLGIPGSIGKPGDLCEAKSDAFVMSANGLGDWQCAVTDAGTVTVQRCNGNGLAQLDAGVGDTLHITVFSHQAQ